MSNRWIIAIIIMSTPREQSNQINKMTTQKRKEEITCKRGLFNSEHCTDGSCLKTITLFGIYFYFFSTRNQILSVSSSTHIFGVGAAHFLFQGKLSTHSCSNVYGEINAHVVAKKTKKNNFQPIHSCFCYDIFLKNKTWLRKSIT